MTVLKIQNFRRWWALAPTREKLKNSSCRGKKPQRKVKIDHRNLDAIRSIANDMGKKL